MIQSLPVGDTSYSEMRISTLTSGRPPDLLEIRPLPALHHYLRAAVLSGIQLDLLCPTLNLSAPTVDNKPPLLAS